MRSIAKKNTSLEVFWYMLVPIALRKLDASSLGSLGERCFAAARGVFLEQTLLDGFVELALGLAQGSSAWLSSEGLGASLMARLVAMLRWRRVAVCFMRLTADLMMGINFLYRLLLWVSTTIKRSL